MADKIRVARAKLNAALARQNVLRMVRAGGHGHIGGAFSAIDIVTALYFDKMNIDPKDPHKEDRDRFLLSAGHKAMCQYAVLAERGYFDKSILDTYGSLHSRIPGHPNMQELPGVEANTGALGHGLSIANGMAMAAKLSGKNFKVYAITGDGELPEGSNWEAAAAAAKFGLDNLTVFVDYNGLQISGRAEDVMNMTPVDEKFRTFGWAVKTINGNDMEQILDTLDELPLQEGKPTMILCKTTKAKGISFGEDKAAFHFWTPKPEELDMADKEAQERVDALRKELEVLEK